jgi:F-type H+-transporting ATPase subunit gamma
VSRRHSVEHLLVSYGEIAEILRAMRNLALMEIHKLGRGLENQRRMVEGIADAAMDLQRHFPAPPSAPSSRNEIVLLLGSERGFCGAFNEAVLSAAGTTPEDLRPKGARLVAVGYRLASRITAAGEATAKLDGATVAEEIPAVLERLMDTLADARDDSMSAPIRVTAIHHHADAQAVETTVLDPLALQKSQDQQESWPPLLHGRPDAVYAQLTRHFLWARLQYLLTDSLMAENQHRLTHMESAMRHVEEAAEALGRQRNALRQEEITEEIETILLSAENEPGFREGLVRAVGDHLF